MLDRVDARTLGAVINKVRSSGGSYAYSYGYYGTSSNGTGAADSAEVLEPQAGPAQVEKTST
jgi:hypothetical protein